MRIQNCVYLQRRLHTLHHSFQTFKLIENPGVSDSLQFVFRVFLKGLDEFSPFMTPAEKFERMRVHMKPPLQCQFQGGVLV